MDMEYDPLKARQYRVQKNGFEPDLAEEDTGPGAGGYYEKIKAGSIVGPQNQRFTRVASSTLAYPEGKPFLHSFFESKRTIQVDTTDGAIMQRLDDLDENERLVSPSKGRVSVAGIFRNYGYININSPAFTKVRAPEKITFRHGKRNNGITQQHHETGQRRSEVLLHKNDQRVRRPTK